jgi:hypothetical protein
MPHDDLARAAWRKSTRSASQEGACVEVADLNSAIGVRDSKDPQGPVLQLDREGFTALADRIRAGDLDL